MSLRNNFQCTLQLGTVDFPKNQSNFNRKIEIFRMEITQSFSNKYSAKIFSQQSIKNSIIMSIQPRLPEKMLNTKNSHKSPIISNTTKFNSSPITTEPNHVRIPSQIRFFPSKKILPVYKQRFLHMKLNNGISMQLCWKINNSFHANIHTIYIFSHYILSLFWQKKIQ